MRQPVKYRPVFAWLLAAAACLTTGSRAGAQQKYRTIPGPLLGGRWGPPPPRPPVEVDPRLPTGVPIPASVPRPEPRSEPPACSARRPVCVHRAPGVAEARAVQALASLEIAYERLVLAMGLPGPLADGGRGGSDGLDLYLEEGAPGLTVEHDPPSVGPIDSASAYCVLRGAGRALLLRSSALCVGEAVAWRMDASETPHARRALATHFWQVAFAPTSVDAERVDDVQANPQVALGGARLGRFSEGSSLLFEYLDAVYGESEPGVLGAGVLALSAGHTAPDRWEWNNEPDLFDVLRHTFGDRPARKADGMIDLAVARAFLGDRSDGGPVPSLDWTGAFGRVRFDWVVEYSSLPRNLAPMRPIEPTGSTFVYVDLDEVALGSGLGIRAEWESPVAFRWALVKVDRDGRPLGRVDPTFQERGTKVEARIVDVTDAAGVLIVGVNMGGVTLAHPFDPDMAPFEPHEYTLLVAAL